MTRDVRDVPSEHRYELTDDGELLGFVTYRTIEDGPPEVRDLRHTEVSPAHRGQGTADALATEVLALLRDAGIRAVVTCDYLRGWAQRHPEANDVVQR